MSAGRTRLRAGRAPLTPRAGVRYVHAMPSPPRLTRRRAVDLMRVTTAICR
ncbi:putative leader peptide [Streptomyces marincola]|uniref:putative leader peptide n=1 Tax=Streptomyces marincola TaxID=2878388 RepID=UPI0038500F88